MSKTQKVKDVLQCNPRMEFIAIIKVHVGRMQRGTDSCPPLLQIQWDHPHVTVPCFVESGFAEFFFFWIAGCAMCFCATVYLVCVGTQ